MSLTPACCVLSSSAAVSSEELSSDSELSNIALNTLIGGFVVCVSPVAWKQTANK